jgi:hypothetical protein
MDSGLLDSLQFAIAEVVGSNPTQFTSFVLVKYGIGLSLILTIVGHFQQQCLLYQQSLSQL